MCGHPGHIKWRTGRLSALFVFSRAVFGFPHGMNHVIKSTGFISLDTCHLMTMKVTAWSCDFKTCHHMTMTYWTWRGFPVLHNIWHLGHDGRTGFLRVVVTDQRVIIEKALFWCPATYPDSSSKLFTVTP